MRLRRLLIAAVLWLLPLGAAAQQDLRVFFFGNSLVHHLTDTDETTVPYWLARLARAGGHGFAADGTWGFLQDFATALPPEPNWSFDGVERVWDSERFAFRRAGFDTIVLTPPNFIQYQGPEVPLDGDNPRRETPLGLATRTFDWATVQVPGARLWVYEGWADMGEFGYPPDATDLARYHAFNAGAGHDWYAGYVADLSEELGHEVRLIPVASVLARLFSETALGDLAVADLYSDDAPHGTPTLYFLASLVTYTSLYGEAPPPLPDLPATIHRQVRDTYPLIADQVWAAVNGLPLPQDQAAAIPVTGVENPALAMGLSGIADWSSQQPFIDLMKTARPWIGHLTGQWGGIEAEALEAGGYLNAAGWPVAIPEGVEALETFVLTDQPEGATSLAGRYRVTWRGTGEVSVGGIARDLSIGDHEVGFSYRPGPGPVGIRISATDPADPVRDIVVIREDQAELHELGEVFNPAWIARIADLRSIRFMDWMMTNGSPQRTWDDRPRVSDYTWGRRGVPLEVMVRLANEIGADPWFTLPHMADDDYAARFATYVHDHLDPDLHVYAEWSNEVWNWIFPQAAWARDRGVERWGEGDDHWMQFAGLRAAEVADIWAGVFAEDPERLVRVISVHTGWFGLEDPLLDAPRAVADGRAIPSASFDAYAVTGYFGFELGEEARADEIRRWIAAGRPEDAAMAALYDGSLSELIGDIWPYHAHAAAERGLRLTMYEGGTHVLAHGAGLEDEALTGFFNDLNYSPQMAKMYADLLTGWQAAGGTMFNAFVDVAVPSKWGSWGALRHLDDRNPRWAVLADWNARAGADWEVRAPGTFAQGILLRGTDAADDLSGTSEGDIVLAGGGDDRIAAGAGDRVHGGPGRDVVSLPGQPGDVTQAWNGAALVLSAPWGTVRVVSVETAVFASAGGATLALMPEEGG